ncbi:MAG: hypothetical protein ACYCVB_08715 [Bacilli bacterium]
MYVYLLAPLALMLAVVVGFGPKRIPGRAVAWMAAIVAALAALEYLTGFFPPINVLFILFIILLAAVLRVIRIVMEHSLPRLMNNRILMIALIAVAAVLAIAVFSGGAIILAIIAWSVYRSVKRPRGPRSVSQMDGLSAFWDNTRKAMNALGPLSLVVIGTAAALVLSGVVAGALTKTAAATTYAPQVALVKARVTSALPPVNVTDVPIVERTNAALVLSNSIGGLGPQYHVSSQGLSLVRYHGQLIWTAPLDYNNGLIWLTKHTTPGYVWTSASNPSAKPALVLGQSYQITPHAGFGYNLGRVLYQNFPTLYIGTSDWELSPQGQGYWVTSLYAPAPGLAGLVTRVLVGSALTNPTTGHVVFYPLHAQPSWVSQIVGPNFAQNEAQRFGWDRAGFFASTFTHQLTTQPVHATPYNVLLGNGGLGWEIPMTSPSSVDNSLAGVILVDAETNQVTYTAFSGVQNDLAVSQRINGATLNSTLSAGRPLLYNVAGALGYIAPVINQSGIVQEVALADPRNTTQPIIASSLTNAFAAWQSYLAGTATPGTAVPGLVHLTAYVTRVATSLESSGASGATVKEYWLYLINGAAFRATLSLNPNVVPFVRPGDLVTVTYIKNSGSPATLQSITDGTLLKAPASVVHKVVTKLHPLKHHSAG